MLHKLRKCSCDNSLNTFQQRKHVLGHFSLLFILLEWPSFSMTDWKQALNLSTFSTTHGKTSLRSPSRELFLTSCSSFSVCLSFSFFFYTTLRGAETRRVCLKLYTCMDENCICHVTAEPHTRRVQGRLVSTSAKKRMTHLTVKCRRCCKTWLYQTFGKQGNDFWEFWESGFRCLTQMRGGFASDHLNCGTV